MKSTPIHLNYPPYSRELHGDRGGGRSPEGDLEHFFPLPAGLLKLCTLGFFFIGHLIDFLLILVQVVGPADRSGYYAPFYGPLLNRTGLFVPIPDNDTISSTCITNYTLELEDMEM